MKIDEGASKAKNALLNLNLGAFYLVCAAISIVGNTQAAAGWLGWIWPMALLAVGSIEFGGVVLSMHADSRRELGERATVTRALSALVAVGAVLGATLGHISQPGQAAFFGGMSTLGYCVYLIHSNAKRRDALRARGDLPEPGPAFGLWQWLRHPIITAQARTLDRGTEDRVAAALAKVKESKRNADAAKAAERIAREQMEKEFGKDRADLMLGIVPFDEVIRLAQIGALERSGAMAEWVLQRSTLPADAHPVIDAEIVPAERSTPVEHSETERSGAEWQVGAERSDRSGAPESGAERSNVIAIRPGAAEQNAGILREKYGADVNAWPSQKTICEEMGWGAGKVNAAVKVAKAAA